MEALARALARRRVPLGFVFALPCSAVASPTRESLMAGAAIGVVGEAIRIWAAGHLEKWREVTTSGPYRFTRHPLYVGSSIMAPASPSLPVDPRGGCSCVVYMASTIGGGDPERGGVSSSAFGDAYDAYAEARAPQVERRSASSAPGETRNTGP